MAHKSSPHSLNNGFYHSLTSLPEFSLYISRELFFIDKRRKTGLKKRSILIGFYNMSSAADIWKILCFPIRKRRRDYWKEYATRK
jgi:hypothetical protein